MSGRVRGRGERASDARGPAARAGGRVASWWWPAADLALLGGLVVLASTLLLPVYGSSAPVRATAVGAAVSAVSVLAVRRWGIPVLATPLLAAAGVMVVGALVVVQPSGFTTVVRGAVEGWRDMLTVATPIGVGSGLLVPPLLIGAGATLLAGMPNPARRPAVALAGPALAFVGCAALGATTTAAAWTAVLGALGVLLSVGWFSWVGMRSARLRAGTLYGSRTIAVRQIVVGSTALVVAATAGAAVAYAAPADRVALRAVVQSPVDPAAFPSPLGDFRRYTKDSADDVQLLVTGLPAGTRLRLAALDAYDGTQFAASDGEGPFVRIGQRRDPQFAGPQTTVRIEVTGYAGAYLPVPGELSTVTFEGGDRGAELTDVLRYSGAAATGLVPGGLRPGDAYVVTGAPTGAVDVAVPADARPAPVPFPATAPLPDLLRATAARYVTGVRGAAAQVEAIRQGLIADGYFSHGLPGEPRSAAGHGLDRMSLLLTAAPMTGDQEQYAAVMALMVRSIGLPARVVVGFAPPADPATTGPGGRPVQVRGSDITAWVEVPFAGLGWVPFDPTPDPDKPMATVEPPAASERRPVGVEVPPALPQSDPDSLAAENAAQRPQDDAPDEAAAPSGPSGLALALWILGGVAALLVLLALPVLIITGLKAARRRRRRRAPTPARQITGGWQELLDTAVDAGYRPEPGQTRSELALSADAALRLALADLTPEADAADFAGHPVEDPTVADRYWSRVDDRVAAVLGGLGRRERWRARLSLASLRDGADRTHA